MPATNAPKSGVVATGEQLNVVDDVKVWTTTQKEKVAETEYKDADGNTIATGAVYQDKTQVHSVKIWYPVQGIQQLADEDFFQIAGDKQATDATLAMRENGRTWNHRGIGMMIGGAVVAITGFLIGNSTASPILEITGGLVVAGGYGAASYGAREMNPETHAVDRSFAERDANKYNQQLGHTVGVNLLRKKF
ncbi:MAG: hypothetical protein ABI467_05370 [Kofleriaceae bacterium]